MSTTYRPNSNLRQPAYNDVSWNVVIDANFSDLDASPMYGVLMCSLAEVPSASLNVKVSAGTFFQSTGISGTCAGTISQALPASSTCSIYVTDAGTITVSTTGWPATPYLPLALVVTGTTTITSLTDARIAQQSSGVNRNTIYLALAGGTFLDATAVVVVHTGTTNGTQFGGTASERVGFHGVAPSILSASANQAALGTLVTATLTDSSGGTASTTLATATNIATITDSTGGSASGTFAVIAAGASYAQADMVAVQNALASVAARLNVQATLNIGQINAISSLAAQIHHAVTDFAAVKTLLNQLRLDLTNKGIIKGSA